MSIKKKNKIKQFIFRKTRESEFINEIKHIFSIKNQNDYKNSPINILTGVKNNEND